MTDATLAELRRGLEAVVRAAMAGGTPDYQAKSYLIGWPEHRLSVWPPVGMGHVPPVSPPELTRGQMLGISAALGGEVEAWALADFLVEQGLDWAKEVYEKGKAEERERVVKLIDLASTAAPTEAAAVLNVLRVCVNDPEAAANAFRKLGDQLAAVLRPLADTYTEFGRAVYRLHNPPPPPPVNSAEWLGLPPLPPPG